MLGPLLTLLHAAHTPSMIDFGWQTWTETDYATMRWLDLAPKGQRPDKDREPLIYDDEPYKSAVKGEKKKDKDKELLELAQASAP